MGHTNFNSECIIQNSEIKFKFWIFNNGSQNSWWCQYGYRSCFGR